MSGSVPSSASLAPFDLPEFPLHKVMEAALGTAKEIKKTIASQSVVFSNDDVAGDAASHILKLAEEGRINIRNDEATIRADIKNEVIMYLARDVIAAIDTQAYGYLTTLAEDETFPQYTHAEASYIESRLTTAQAIFKTVAEGSYAASGTNQAAEFDTAVDAQMAKQTFLQDLDSEFTEALKRSKNREIYSNVKNDGRETDAAIEKILNDATVEHQYVRQENAVLELAVRMAAIKEQGTTPAGVMGLAAMGTTAHTTDTDITHEISSLIDALQKKQIEIAQQRVRLLLDNAQAINLNPLKDGNFDAEQFAKNVEQAAWHVDKITETVSNGNIHINLTSFIGVGLTDVSQQYAANALVEDTIDFITTLKKQQDRALQLVGQLHQKQTREAAAAITDSAVVAKEAAALIVVAQARFAQQLDAAAPEEATADPYGILKMNAGAKTMLDNAITLRDSAEKAAEKAKAELEQMGERYKRSMEEVTGENNERLVGHRLQNVSTILKGLLPPEERIVEVRVPLQVAAPKPVEPSARQLAVALFRKLTGRQATVSLS